MRVLFDVVHPAHVHFYRYMIRELEAGGHETRVVARDKDVTLDLLEALGIPHLTVPSGGGGLVNLGRELVRRVRALRRVVTEFRPDVVLTRNPSGVQAARLSRVPGVFDTDDGKEVGLHFRAAAPFATAITTPDCLSDDYGRRHVKYPSYKGLAFLHPDRFRPDPSVVAELGVDPASRYFLVRFVAMAASHDRAETGMSVEAKRDVIARLARRGSVFITSEGPLPEDLEPLRLRLPAHRFHDVLAFASLVVGDSQSVAGEAALLGVPSVRCSSFSGRLAPLVEMEHRYGLTFELTPDRLDEFMATTERLADLDSLDEFQERRRRLLEDKCDLTAWYLDFVSGLVAQRRP